MSSLFDIGEFINRKIREMVNLAEQHRKTMERNEADHKEKIRELESKIERLQRENTRSQNKLNRQKEKEFTQLELLKTKHKKAIELKEREMRESEERCKAEIKKKMKELDMVQDEIEAGKRSVAEVSRQEEIFRNLHSNLIEVHRLWLPVLEEMDPIMMMEHTDEKSKEMFEVMVTVLQDMRDRKQEMNDFCKNKCAMMVEVNKNLIGGDTVNEILTILEKIGKPFECLEELIRQARKQAFGNTKALETEVSVISKLMRQLENIRPAPRATVLKVLDQKFAAIAC